MNIIDTENFRLRIFTAGKCLIESCSLPYKLFTLHPYVHLEMYILCQVRNFYSYIKFVCEPLSKDLLSLNVFQNFNFSYEIFSLILLAKF